MNLVNDHKERIRRIMQQIENELSNVKKIAPKQIYTSVINTSSKNSSSKSNESQASNDKETQLNNAYKQRALKAYKQNKIFTVYGNYYTVRNALIRRGWIEKLSPGRFPKLERLSLIRLLKGARKGNNFETVVLSKIVQPYQANFIWQPKYLKDQYSSGNPYRNRVRRARCLDFSTKVGLIGCFENSQWHTIENIAETTCIPSYKLNNKDEELHFKQDFQISQCIGVLVYLLESEKEGQLFNQYGIIPMSFLEITIEMLENYCKKQKEDFVEAPSPEQQNDFSKWEVFTANTELLLRKNQHIIFGSEEECSKILTRIREVLEKVQQYKPFLNSYGYRNLWILKPGFQCRGQGILIMSNFYNIINYAASRPKSNYIVQKYIEKPLLIYKTKFDIRQYMVVAIFDDISIWMYKDCYLRFSSREFSLSDLREAIHITNNSIQKKYKNGERDVRLPKHNMWHLSEFKSYLSDQNKSGAWNNKIYTGFKKNLISIVLASLEETDLTKNSFELYGCDFMLDESLNPFLIEINSTPDLSASTAVTAKICPTALEDLMKVVLDYPNNPKASTGNFELVYRIQCSHNCQSACDLVAIGTAKILHHPPKILSKKSKVKKFFRRKVLRKRSENLKAPSK